jgi:hypothetical protein
MLKTLRDPNPVIHVADRVVVTGLNEAVSVRDNSPVVCIHFRQLVVNVRLMAIAKSVLAIQRRPAMIGLAVRERVIGRSHLEEIWGVKPSVSDVRILAVRILRWPIPVCVVRRPDHRNRDHRNHGLRRLVELNSRIGPRRVVDHRVLEGRSIQAVLLRAGQLRGDQVRMGRLPVELRQLVVRVPMIRETMASVLVMGLMWKNDSRQHAVSVGRNAVSDLRLARISSLLPCICNAPLKPVRRGFLSSQFGNLFSCPSVKSLKI